MNNGKRLSIAVILLSLLACCIEEKKETEIEITTTTKEATTTYTMTTTATTATTTTTAITTTTTTKIFTTTSSTTTSTTFYIDATNPGGYGGYEFRIENVVSTSKGNQYEFEIKTPDNATKTEVFYEKSIIDGLEFGVMEKIPGAIKVKIYVQKYSGASKAPLYSTVFTIGGKDYRMFEREYMGYRFRQEYPRSLEEVNLRIQKPDEEAVYCDLREGEKTTIDDIEFGILEISSYPGGYTVAYAQTIGEKDVCFTGKVYCRVLEGFWKCGRKCDVEGCLMLEPEEMVYYETSPGVFYGFRLNYFFEHPEEGIVLHIVDAEGNESEHVLFCSGLAKKINDIEVSLSYASMEHSYVIVYIKPPDFEDCIPTNAHLLEGISGEEFIPYKDYGFRIDHFVYSRNNEAVAATLDVEKPDGSIKLIQSGFDFGGKIDNLIVGMCRLEETGEPRFYVIEE
ncbi:MAG: hypothetical protein JW778_03195 [Candidatus Altiarchaeota archaeon]|nr:hypothetical protein [Candidatus Altiarchaeota archaeon]